MYALLIIVFIAGVVFLLWVSKNSGANAKEKPDDAPREIGQVTVREFEEKISYKKRSEGAVLDYSFKIDSVFPNSYTAIDFETATVDGMACQLGLVQVEDGQIVLEREFLIKPPENRYDEWNTRVHGIGPDQTVGAATFSELWPELRPLFEDRHIVAHNMAFDKSVLEKNLAYYGLSEPKVLSYECTCAPFDSVSLYSAARFFGIELGRHHDALSDARACALLVLEYGKHFGEVVHIPKLKEKSQRSIDKKNRGWAEDLQSIPDNFFKGKTVVITGTLERERDEVAEELKSLGARVVSSISRKTSIVIAGYNPGPTKMQKIEELRQAGVDIVVLGEDELQKKLEHVAGTKPGQKSANFVCFEKMDRP